MFIEKLSLGQVIEFLEEEGYGHQVDVEINEVKLVKGLGESEDVIVVRYTNYMQKDNPTGEIKLWDFNTKGVSPIRWRQFLFDAIGITYKLHYLNLVSARTFGEPLFETLQILQQKDGEIKFSDFDIE